MSNSSQTTPMEAGTKTGNNPRAIIHKKILDEAQASPKASIEEIATTVSGASADLVERVLEDYGDPMEANDEPNMLENPTESHSKSTAEGPPESMNGEDTQASAPLDPQELTDKQRRTLRAVYDHPGATQVEIAEKLDVTNVTVSNRVNEIEGFDWNEREEFVNQIFENETIESSVEMSDGLELQEETSAEIVEKVDALADEVDSLKQQLMEQPVQSLPIVVEPALAAKLIHACMGSDNITEEEELEIIEAIIFSARSEH